MSRVIKISKVSKSTIVEIIDGDKTTEIVVFNKLTDLLLRNEVIEVRTETNRLCIQYDEIFDKLSSTDIKDYLTKAAEAMLFNQ